MRIVRWGSWCVPAAVLTWCLVLPAPAAAQEVARDTSLVTPGPFQITAAGLRAAAEQEVSDPARNRLPLRSTSEEASRPAALLPLYVSLAALQGMDFHSTRRALDTGSGREANPAMRGVVSHGAAFFALKAGATVGVVWASEKMWKKNRKGAVIFATVVNAAMAAIVANNYRVSR